MDYLRLKLSFDDITRLYRFLDKNGYGNIGYNEMILLKDENWRRVKDPYAVLQQNIRTKLMVQDNKSTPTNLTTLSKSVSGLALSAS